MATTTALTTAQWTVQQIPSLLDKVVIVTGANSGIGFHTALELARNDATVVLACRNKTRAEEAIDEIKKQVKNAQLTFIELDLSSLKSVEAFVEEFLRQFHRLDVLVNNAGLMYPAQTHTKDGLETQFAVNHLGHFYLTKLLFETIKRTHGARVVNVSSVGHRLARRLDVYQLARSTPNKWFYFTEYNESKLCNLLFTYELDRRLGDGGLAGQVLSVAAHPGVSATNLTPNVVTGYLPRFLHSPVCKFLSITPIFQSAAQGAIPILYAATSKAVRSGEYYGPNGFQNFWGRHPVKEASSNLSHSEELATKLWWLSEDVSKCRFHVTVPPADDDNPDEDQDEDQHEEEK